MEEEQEMEVDWKPENPPIPAIVIDTMNAIQNNMHTDPFLQKITSILEKTDKFNEKAIKSVKNMVCSKNDYQRNLDDLRAAHSHPDAHFQVLFDTFQRIFDDRKMLFSRACEIMEVDNEDVMDAVERELFGMVHVEEAIGQWAELLKEENGKVREMKKRMMVKRSKEMPATASVIFLLPTLSSTAKNAIKIQGGWGVYTDPNSKEEESAENPNAVLDESLQFVTNIIEILKKQQKDAAVLFSAYDRVFDVYETLITHIFEKIDPLKRNEKKALIDGLINLDLVKKHVEELNRVTGAIGKQRRATYMAKEVLEQVINPHDPMIKVVFNIPTTNQQFRQFVLKGSLKLDNATVEMKTDAEKDHKRILKSL